MCNAGLNPEYKRTKTNLVVLPAVFLLYIILPSLHLSLAASVHFQHTAELVKLLSAHSVNYTSQVSMSTL